MTTVPVQLLIVLALIGLNGFFAMAEMALVASRKARLTALAEAGSRRARTCLRLLEHPEAFLAAVQIGITLAGVLGSAYGGATLAPALAAALAWTPALAPYAEALSLAGVVAPIALLTLLLGELAPKRLALARPEPIALFAAPAMRWLMLVSRPAVWFLGLATRATLRLLGLGGEGAPTVTEEDIRGILLEGRRHGVIEDAEHDIMERLLRLADRPLGVIMTHRSRADWLDIEADEATILEQMLTSSHTRFPVCRGDFNNVLGVVRTRDVLAGRIRAGRLDLAAYLVQPHYLPETMRGIDLLLAFRDTPGLKLALVVDEYGEAVGVVTVADVFADMVGELAGQAGAAEADLVRRPDGSLLADAATPVDEVAAALGLPRPWPEDFAAGTLAGFILSRLGHIPHIGETFAANGAVFEVVDMDGRRIDRVLVTPPSEEEEGS
ncbi:hemolysin family protein [Desulfovibrio sp. TomC]|uniref:hemolysin family protein n=1 Tax=Desulfovibrio sp. TomC TaxID=1562888 RepID=UPI000573C67B|nr:hemolysin family protein [Desulfovibrio sp. TomC]KHK02490.1 Magnesium and cobalt efflux protein CorC [Desulfovibrio sp. TomC]